jgi:hypothetical protein
MTPAGASDASLLFWLLVVGATWIGVANAIREVVKEAPIVRRELALGLSPGAYVLSKIAVLGIMTATECAVLAIASLLIQALPPTDPLGQKVFTNAGVLFAPLRLEIVVDLIIVGLTGMTIGLLLSVLVRNADQANFTLPLVLVAQIVLSAPLFGAPSPAFETINVVSSAQWGTAAIGATVDLNLLRHDFLYAIEQQRAQADGRMPVESKAAGSRRWDHNFGAWQGDIAALLAMTLGALALMRIILVRRLAPSVTRRSLHRG